MLAAGVEELAVTMKPVFSARPLSSCSTGLPSAPVMAPFLSVAANCG